MFDDEGIRIRLEQGASPRMARISKGKRGHGRQKGSKEMTKENWSGVQIDFG